jgi:flavin-dependent dehydrogenase
MMPDVFDIAIIGAGPAGLNAARTGASLGLATILLEKSAYPVEEPQARYALVYPVPEIFSGYRRSGWIHFPELELVISQKLANETAARLHYVSPSGYEFQVEPPDDDRHPVFLLNKTAFLKILAVEARAAGAELRYSTPAARLIFSAGQVVGVQTHWQDIYARVVISAEGPSHYFCEQAGLFARVMPSSKAIFTISEQLRAPHVQQEHLGLWTAFGKRDTTLPNATVSLLVPAPGEAEIRLQVLQNGSVFPAPLPMQHYLEEYKLNDPRFRQLLAGATGTGQITSCQSLRPPPPSLVSPGFIGCGTAVFASAQIGLLSSIYLGKLAARAAEKSLRTPENPLPALVDYNLQVRRVARRLLHFESWLATRLSQFEDDQIDRLCLILKDADLAPAFFGQSGRLTRESGGWLIRRLPALLRDWQLWLGVLSGGQMVA